MTVAYFFYMLLNTAGSVFIFLGALNYIKRDGADTGDWVAVAALVVYAWLSIYFMVAPPTVTF